MGGGADDGRVLRHVFDHGGIGADFGVFADGDGSQNLRAGADDDIVFNRGVAFAALAAVGLGAAEGNAVYMVTLSPMTAVSPMTTPMPWSIKKFLPIWAPGWISTPVSSLPNCDNSRAESRQPFCHRWCDRR